MYTHVGRNQKSPTNVLQVKTNNNIQLMKYFLIYKISKHEKIIKNQQSFFENDNHSCN